MSANGSESGGSGIPDRSGQGHQPWLFMFPVVALLIGASAFGGLWGDGGTATDRSMDSPAALAGKIDSLEDRVGAIERLLGSESRVASPTRPTTLRESYRALQRRVETLAEEEASRWRAIPSLAPIQKGRITSPYTSRRFHPIRKRVTPHYGLDLAARDGTPIRAAADGVVSAVAQTPSYGNGVDIDHGNGFVTRYAHASRLAVREGEDVRRGDIVAYVGDTGLATGPHLHYEIFYEGWSVDPINFMLDESVDVGAND